MTEQEIAAAIQRAEKYNPQSNLFDTEFDWQSEWWDMPEFTIQDCSPQYRLVVNFMTREDRKEFAEKLGIKLTEKTDSTFFPQQAALQGQYAYTGGKFKSRYPICIPSKGRHDCQTTGRALDRLGVDYKFFVESDEYDLYSAAVGADKVISMPFNNLGQGSIPARNFIWEWAKEHGHARHWCVDDNIKSFGRMNLNRRINIHGGAPFLAMEDFVDRYENIALAGPHNQGFCGDRSADTSPFFLNSRVYSCSLIKTDLPYRWRGRYNEDTDLSLRVLKDGHCTVLFRSILMDKGATAFAKRKAMRGGNTDNVYNTNDHRRAFAESLKEQHSDCVEVVWKFNRWHHQVDYSRFKGNKLIRKKSVTPIARINNYGMVLAKVKE